MKPLAVFWITLASCQLSFAQDFEAQTVAALGKLGGFVKIDEKLDEMARASVKFEKADDALLVQVAKLPAVGAIEIADATRVTEAGYTALKELPDLQKLAVFKGSIGEKAGAAIGTLRTLDTLVLNDAKLTDLSLAGMKRLTNLKVFDLLDANITDRSLTIISGMTKLVDLNLSGTKVTDAGILTLQVLKKLKMLRVTRTNVTPKGVTAIEEACGKTLTVRF